MGGGGSAPQFNAQQTANSQKEANVQTGIANATLGNTNQVTPYGNLNYTESGGRWVGDNFVPSYTATQTLSPDQQNIYDKGARLQNRALDLAPTVLGNVERSIGQPLNFDGLQGIPDVQGLRDNAYKALTARGTEDINRAEGASDVQLANQGIAKGSVAANRAEDKFGRARNDLSTQAEIDAGNIAAQHLNQALSIRNQGIGERTTLHNAPLQDYQALLGFGGGVQAPQYAPGSAGQIQATDVTTPAMQAYQGQMNAYNQQQSSQNALMGGLFGLGGAALGGAFRNPKMFGLG